MTNMKERVIDHAAPIALGGVIGGFAAAWNYYEAQAAVAVRPRLNDVDFITALLTGHGFDWLFYTYPTAAVVVQVLVVVVICWVGWRL